LVVYGDFQCSACEAFFPIESQVLQKYLGQITFTFRNFPIESLHPNALAAARAAEAASLQGKFFEMHDLLYQNQSSWENLSDPLPYFEQMASSLSLNMNKFKTDFASEAVNNTIAADMQDGTKKGVDGTPAYFLNGTKLNNQDIDSVASFSAKIDQAIKAATTQKSN
jgi:protein-disulfide isomerase